MLCSVARPFSTCRAIIIKSERFRDWLWVHEYNKLDRKRIENLTTWVEDLAVWEIAIERSRNNLGISNLLFVYYFLLINIILLFRISGLLIWTRIREKDFYILLLAYIFKKKKKHFSEIIYNYPIKYFFAYYCMNFIFNL